ncbi:glycosyl hydrolases family 38 C-terminal domain protein [Mycobacterium xenopi 4042]|uniref:Glycosyl hydrolases family 38 C-terminal domain protein n=1 Tax=Mycobacterium xenopi 4042 TaxID=1299334 RepID=X8EET1_MYCXE|nr:glycosyl hydrolases family 38 C-terminal domain protein [Mycobacterium xenopi 4042]
MWNSLAHKRTNVVTVRLDTPGRVFDADGDEMPAVVEPDGHSVTFLARDVPSLGWRAYRVLPCEVLSGWKPLSGNVIANEHYRLSVDRRAAVGVVLGSRRPRADRRGRVGNELALYEEYPSHPSAGEGPGTCCPKPRCVLFVGSVRGARLSRPARAAAGHPRPHRPVAALHADADPVARHRAVDCRTRIDEFTGTDQLLRLRWPCPVAGAMPVSEVGDAVVGRGFALLHADGRAVDTARYPWTLDNPAYGWFGLSSAARVRWGRGAGVSVAEVVSPTETTSGPLARALMIALVRAGSRPRAAAPTSPATDTSASTPTCGHSCRAGRPDQNVFTKAVLATAHPPTAPNSTVSSSRPAGQGVGARVAPLARLGAGADLREPRALRCW